MGVLPPRATATYWTPELVTCIEASRRLLAVPTRHDGELHAHIAGCLHCRQLARDLMRLDRHIAEVARAPAPDGLAARVLLKHSTR